MMHDLVGTLSPIMAHFREVLARNPLTALFDMARELYDIGSLAIDVGISGTAEPLVHLARALPRLMESAISFNASSESREATRVAISQAVDAAYAWMTDSEGAPFDEVRRITKEPHTRH